MAKMCYTCRRMTSVIHCLTEAQNFCVTCDYLRHSEHNAGHVRHQLCDSCMTNPALLLCVDHGIALCQSCYLLHYNCAPSGHHIQIICSFPQEYHNNNNNNNNNQHHRHQRIEGMFEMICNGNNDCDRRIFPLKCESCVASDAVVYCAQHDHLLCDNCDRIIHHHESLALPHMRRKLCLTCKRLSRNFLIGAHHFILPPAPPPHPPAAEEVTASPSAGPSQQDSNFF